MTVAIRRIDRLAAEWWLVLMLASALVVASIASNFAARFDLLFYDALQRSRPHKPQPRIMLIAIDDRSLTEIGPWPWPREMQARLLTALAQGKPQRVALDLLLLEKGDAAGDRALETAIKNGPPTYLPVQFAIPGQNGTSFTVMKPIEQFLTAAAGTGHVNLIPDADGSMRRAFLTFADGRSEWYHLMTQLTGQPQPTRKTAAQSTGPAALIARDPALIAFTGPQGTFPTISAASVINGHVPPEALADKLLLVGVTATGIGDAYATPVGSDHSLMPGLEIQANLLDSMLSKRLIYPVTGIAPYLFGLVAILIMMLCLRFIRPRWTIWAWAGLLVTTLGLSIALLAQGFWIAPSSAVLGLIAVYPLWNWRRLAAVSSFMAHELEKLHSESDPLERARPSFAGADVVDRQIGLLGSAIDRGRDLRRFLTDRIVQMPDAVLVTDLAGKVVIANEGALALWRSLEGEGTPGTVHELLGRLKVDCDSARLASWQAQTICEDGRSFTVRAESQRAADDSEIGAVFNIAETTELVTAQRQKELAQRQREEVLQLLSHDMRAPQVSILTMLQDGAGDTIKPPMTQRIRECAERTLSLADGFVHLSRAQSLRFDPKVINLVDVAHEAADALWAQAKARNVTISTDLPQEAELLVLGDHSLLVRMLVNLIDNAIRVSPEGQQVLVTASLITRDDKAYCQAVVTDNGPGFSDEQLQSLYARFQTGGQVNLKSAGGVGLGLAFVLATVKRHDGEIACDSSADKGTRFEILLPCHAATP